LPAIDAVSFAVRSSDLSGKHRKTSNIPREITVVSAYRNDLLYRRGLRAMPGAHGAVRPWSVTISFIEREVLAFCLFQPSCLLDIATHYGGLTHHSEQSGFEAVTVFRIVPDPDELGSERHVSPIVGRYDLKNMEETAQARERVSNAASMYDANLSEPIWSSLFNHDHILEVLGKPISFLGMDGHYVIRIYLLDGPCDILPRGVP